MPVSYTHLDVYKRQLLRHSQGNGWLPREHPLARPTSPRVRTSRSVSYTHLSHERHDDVFLHLVSILISRFISFRAIPRSLREGYEGTCPPALRQLPYTPHPSAAGREPG